LEGKGFAPPGTLFLKPLDRSETFDAITPLIFRSTLGYAATQMPLATAAPSLLSFSPQLDLRYVTTDGQDPASLEQARRETSPLAYHLRDGPGTSRGHERRLPSQTSALLAWAKENGWLIDTNDLVRRFGFITEECPGAGTTFGSTNLHSLPESRSLGIAVRGDREAWRRGGVRQHLRNPSKIVNQARFWPIVRVVVL